MRFLCDVHISYKLVNHIISFGFEVIHVNQILDKWNTKDKDISEYSDFNDLILISKDHDFRNSFFIKGSPRKLIKINLGNISNEELIKIFTENLKVIERINKKKSYMIEIDKDYITVTENKKF